MLIESSSTQMSYSDRDRHNKLHFGRGTKTDPRLLQEVGGLDGRLIDYAH
jgi:hypothetical protein